MPDLTFARILLSFFTTAEKAGEIEGDLIEQAQVHGKLWFALHLLHTAFSLFLHTLLKELLPIFLLAYGVYELLVKVQFWAVLPFRWYLKDEFAYTSTTLVIGTYAFWMLLACGVGASLVRLLPRIGMHVVLGTCALVVARVFVVQAENSVMQALLDVMLALVFGVFPMLLGGFLAQRRNLPVATPHISLS